jgi:acyl-CoA thioesterase
MQNHDIELARKIVLKMYEHDAFSKWLAVQIRSIQMGDVQLSLQIRKEFTNGFGIAHGGIAYSLADSALAFSSNTYGKHAVSIETSISHTKPVFEGDILTTLTEELSQTKALSIFQIKVINQKQDLIAIFKGTVFKKEKAWEI